MSGRCYDQPTAHLRSWCLEASGGAPRSHAGAGFGWSPLQVSRSPATPQVQESLSVWEAELPTTCFTCKTAPDQQPSFPHAGAGNSPDSTPGTLLPILFQEEEGKKGGSRAVSSGLGRTGLGGRGVPCYGRPVIRTPTRSAVTRALVSSISFGHLRFCCDYASAC